MSAAGCGLSACTLNRRLPWLHVGWSALAPMAKVRFETPSQRTSAVVVREPGPKCECNFSHCAHSRCHVDRTPWDPYKYSTQLTTTLAQALVKLSSPPVCCDLTQSLVSRIDLRPASAYPLVKVHLRRSDARWAWRLEPPHYVETP